MFRRSARKLSSLEVFLQSSFSLLCLIRCGSIITGGRRGSTYSGQKRRLFMHGDFPRIKQFLWYNLPFLVVRQLMYTTFLLVGKTTVPMCNSAENIKFFNSAENYFDSIQICIKHLNSKSAKGKFKILSSLFDTSLVWEQTKVPQARRHSFGEQTFS